MEAPPERDFGPQPLDGLLRSLGLENSDLVAASTEQLTHKQVQKARRGRYVTPNIRRKIQHALQAAMADRAPEPPGEGGDKGETPPLYPLEALFNYRS
jgi:hypothetical protein